jgi:hypothetical protein
MTCIIIRQPWHTGWCWAAWSTARCLKQLTNNALLPVTERSHGAHVGGNSRAHDYRDGVTWSGRRPECDEQGNTTLFSDLGSRCVL